MNTTRQISKRWTAVPVVAIVLAGCHRPAPAPTPTPTPTPKPATPSQLLGIKIIRALIGNPGLHGAQFNVGTSKTTVTLNGTVRTTAQRQLAERIARQNAPGYKLENHLVLAKATTKPAAHKLSPHRSAPVKRR